MTSAAEPSRQRTARSADELYAWAVRRLHSGASGARLAVELIDRGLPASMAQYFARHVADETYPARRAYALRLAMEGAAWLVGSLLVIIAIRAAGRPPGPGPSLLGWAVVACGILRVLGGLLTLPRNSRARRAASHQAIAVPSQDGAPSLLDFQTLGLEPNAPLTDIQQSYRELARIWHPDRFADSADMRSRAELRMKRINAAYSRLSRRALEQTT